MEELDNYESDNDEGIIAVVEIPQQPPHAPLVVNNTNNNNYMGCDEDAVNTESDDNKIVNSDNAESKDDKPSNLAVVTDLDGNKPDKNQGVQRLKRRGKGVTKK